MVPRHSQIKESSLPHPARPARDFSLPSALLGFASATLLDCARSKPLGTSRGKPEQVARNDNGGTFFSLRTKYQGGRFESLPPPVLPSTALGTGRTSSPLLRGTKEQG